MQKVLNLIVETKISSKSASCTCENFLVTSLVLSLLRKLLTCSLNLKIYLLVTMLTFRNDLTFFHVLLTASAINLASIIFFQNFF